VSFLLDTNVVSEIRRKKPDPSVMAWLRQVDHAKLRLSVLTLGEITKGVHLLARRDPNGARQLTAWLDGLRQHYADRLLGIDGTIAETWGRLATERALPLIDGLLAATALVHGLTLVTRNVRDVAGTGVALLNPWEPTDGPAR